MENENISYTMTLKDGRELRLDSVEGILLFDESSITLGLGGGRVEITGADLKICELTKDRGEILVTGRIDAVSFEGARERGGVLTRLFK